LRSNLVGIDINDASSEADAHKLVVTKLRLWWAPPLANLAEADNGQKRATPQPACVAL